MLSYNLFPLVPLFLFKRILQTYIMPVAAKWAERKDRLFITVEAANGRDVKVDFQADKLTVTGIATTSLNSEEGPFAVEINLQKPIEVNNGSFKVLGQTVQIVAIKANKEEEYWMRLTKEPTKTTKNWLSADWGLWKDEEEEIKGEQVDFGGYGDLNHMVQSMQGGDGGKKSSADEVDEPPLADISDLDGPHTDL